jgi:uncharacterized protein (TIGR01777 family)
MKIVVTGGTGFIGEALVRRLLARGDDVAVLTRDPARVRAGRGLQWDGRMQGAWSGDAARADAVINLAGENISEGRWTAARKQRLVDSRINATRAVVEALQREPSRPRTLVNASAVGYDGDRGEEVLDESSRRGEGFLAQLVEQWESEARAAEPLARLVIVRFGVVLAPGGGALKKMSLPFRFGAGGPIGSGRQWMSWIAREDVLRMMEWAIDTRAAHGVYNATSPEPVRNRDLARALGHELHRPSFMPAPAFALRLALGQMADEALLASQRAVPAHAAAEGFTFSLPSIDAALRGV